MSIKRKLLAVVSLLIFGSVMLVTLLTYRNDRQYLLEQSTETTQLLLEQLTLNTDTYLTELFRLCLSPYYNKRVMAQLEDEPVTAAQRLAKQRVIEDYLREVLTVPRNDILRAHILTDAVYSSSKTRYDASIAEDYPSEGWYHSALSTDAPVFIPVYAERQGKATLSVFSVVQKLRSTQDASRVLGVIRVDANFQGIKTVCDRVTVAEGNALFLLDSAGNVIYEHSKLPQGVSLSDVRAALAQSGEPSFSVSLGGESYALNRRPSSATDWQLIDLHSMRSLTETATQARNRAIALAVLFAALGVAVTVVLLRLFLRPIFEVTALMAKVRAGDLSVRARVAGNDELTYLERSFNEMTAQIHDEMERNSLLTRQVYEARYLEKEAQYAALCSQIQPHFLFNAFNTISLLVKCGRSDEAVQCIEMLATLLRGMVDTDRQITLAAEMRIVESYLALQQKRHDNLRYTLPDCKGFEGVLLPAMSVQPLVENALVHGLEPMCGEMRVEVALRTEGDALLVSVRDNGMGIPSAQLDKLRERLAADAPDSEQPTGSGVGLVNISRRIRLKYGAAYGVAIQSAQSGGTTATLRLPRGGNVECIAP